MILEGDAADARDDPALARALDAYELKYGHRIDPGRPGFGVYAVRPRIAHTWNEEGFPRTAVRWVFETPPG